MTTSPAGPGRLHEAMAARVARKAFPGIVTLVARGEDVHVHAIGTLAFDRAEPMQRNTIFRITSMTKPILASATMMLVDDGTLALDEPVDRLLPELTNRRVLEHIDGPLDSTVPADRPITVEDLLTFRLGHGLVVEPTFDPPFPVIIAANELELAMGPPEPRTPHAPDEWIKRFATLPLMYQPGQRWQYNTGALVLSVLVARAARQSLSDVLRVRIFEPLGMTDTAFVVPRSNITRLAQQYMPDFGTGELHVYAPSAAEVWTTPPVFPSGAGGLVSTVDDYLAFARLLLNRGIHQGHRLLSERSVELMTTNHLTAEQIAGGGPLLDGQGWGYGMAVSVQPDDVSAPGRYGWAGGYGSVWFNDPQRDLIAMAMSQAADFLFNGSADEFARLAAAAA